MWPSDPLSCHMPLEKTQAVCNSPDHSLLKYFLSLLLAFHLAYVPMSSGVWKLELVSLIVLPGSRRFSPSLAHRHVNKEGGRTRVNINKSTWAKCVCIDFLCCRLQGQEGFPGEIGPKVRYFTVQSQGLCLRTVSEK